MKIQVTQYDKEYIITSESEDLTSHELLDLMLSIMRGMSYGETAIHSALKKVLEDNDEAKERAEHTQTLKDCNSLVKASDLLSPIRNTWKATEDSPIFDEETFIHKSSERVQKMHEPQLDESKDILKEEGFKVGDIIEVTSLDQYEERFINVGSKFKIEEADDDGDVWVDIGLKHGLWILRTDQIKKVN